uniref:SJCHGC05263 protein n=1 Tax=Schistosoma japonicum TaxID=6182 RepID=Q5DHG7_SCHJA|nr:SJCHGC05263 protein [Schistosoma japonicum]
MESQVPHLSLKYIDILSLINNSSATNQSRNSTIPEWSNPWVQTSIVFIVIGLIFGLIIILVKRLHTQSTGNNVFIAVTMIILSTGIILLNVCIQKYLALISEGLSAGLTTIAMIIGSRIRGFSRQSKTTVIVFLCIFILLGIVFTSIGFLNNILYILAGICWSGAMFIVIILTSYYVMIRFPGYFSSLYVTFVIFYEFVITTLIILSCSICYLEVNQTNSKNFSLLTN